MPYIDINGYPGVPNEYLTIKDVKNPGQYLHRMIVWSFGDCNGKEYKSYPGYEIDHIDMNHKNNSIENLQLVPKGINLWRAADRTGSKACKERLQSYLDTLTDFEKEVLMSQIKADIRGQLK